VGQAFEIVTKALHIVRDGQPSPSPDAIEDLWDLVRFLQG
jgi:hypothetical protein